MTITNNKKEREREKRRFNRLIDLVSLKYSNKFRIKIKKAMIQGANSYLNVGYLQSQQIAQHQKELRSVAFKMYSNSIELASDRQFQSIKNHFPLEFETKDTASNTFQDLALEFILVNSRRLAKQLSETTERNIRGAILRAQQEGLSSSETATVIRDRAEFMSRSRSLTIAVTESHNALSWAKHESTKQISNELGLDLKKTWESVQDERTRISHSSADGQSVDMSDVFIVGGELLKYPGDENGSAGNTINCRCTETYGRKKGG